MGTRHLIAVMHDGQYKIAQYGQWDGYPSGQGLTVLRFLQKMDRAAFTQKVDAAQFMTEADFKEFGRKVDAGEIKNWTKEYPHLSRDAGADVLAMVASAEPGIKLKNSITFAADSLFCEYAYVVDLDKGTFEVFQGFNKEPLQGGERFYGVTEEGVSKEYSPVKHIHTFQLEALPTEDDFLKVCEPQEEEE